MFWDFCEETSSLYEGKNKTKQNWISVCRPVYMYNATFSDATGYSYNKNK